MSTEGTPAANAPAPGNAAPANTAKAPETPAIPAGHKIVSEAEWNAAQEAASQYKQWKPAVEVLSREKLTADDVAKAFAPEPPKPQVGGQPNPAYIADAARAAARAEIAQDKHDSAMEREPSQIESLVTGVLPQGANDTLKTFLGMAASQRLSQIRETYPQGHALAGRPMPITPAKQAELKAWLDTEGKKLLGAMAAQTVKPGAPVIAGYQAPSGAPQNAAPQHISKWSEQDRRANAEGIIARIKAG